jgi:hypothetical protein
MKSKFYNTFVENMVGNVDYRWNAPTDIQVYALLVKSNFVFNENHVDIDDLDLDETEVTGFNYIIGGKVLENRTVVNEMEAGKKYTRFKASPTIWEDSTISAYGCLLYNRTLSGVNPHRLICFIDFEEEQKSVDGDLTIRWSGAGNDIVIEIEHQ